MLIRTDDADLRSLLLHKEQLVQEFWWKAASHVIAIIDDWIIALLRTPQLSLPVLFNGPHHPQNCPFLWGSRLPCKYMVPWAHMVSPSKRHLYGFSRFCTVHQCDQHTDTQTHRSRYEWHLSQQAASMACIWCGL